MASIKDKVERAFSLMDSGDLDRLGELFDPACEFVMPGIGKIPGFGPFREVLGVWLAGFPDLRHEVLSIVESGDRAGYEVRVTGTHTGPLRGPQGEIPATGKKVVISAADAVALQGGKFTSWHVYFDQLDFLQQLGIAPGQ